MRYFAIAMCTLVLSCEAYAQRIPDLSLSPAETAEQPNNAPATNDRPITNLKNAPLNFQNDVSRRVQDVNRRNAPPLPLPTGKQPATFMEKYCDPSFVSILANNRKYFGQEQCLQNQRDDACARFHGLPQEVKTVLDEAISCLFSNGSGYVSDTMKNESEECGVTYMKRIELLKKYLGEAYSSYALVFLPDTVLDTGGACVNRR